MKKHLTSLFTVGGGWGRKWDGDVSSSYQRAESSLPGACPYTLLGPSFIMCVII